MKGSQFDVLIQKMQKEYGLALPDVNKVGVIDRLPFDSPRLNYMFSGGYPIGRISELHGLESGGKTVLANYIGGHFQRRTDGGPRKVLFIDQEYSFARDYANTVGLNTDDDFIIIQPLHGEEGFTIAQELVKTGEIGFIIWDSVTATPTNSAMEEDFGKRCVGPDTEVTFRVKPTV